MVCAGGSGGFHFLAPPDPIEPLHEASQSQMLEQRRRLQAEHRGGSLRLLDHNHTVYRAEGIDAKHSRYDINGKVYASCIEPCPMPPKSAAAHWMCQVSGTVGGFDVISGLPLHVAHVQHRQAEVQHFWAKQTARASDGTQLAGQVSPQKPVDHTSFHHGKMMPRPRELHGVKERTLMLSS
mmetsp:Transcript_97673/g.280626  ORF Transcript_97673/g.280626 Transcript_97673/m.280626 type:complete len:181 (-) Transcript_97673:65-607(-)